MALATFCASAIPLLAAVAVPFVTVIFCTFPDTLMVLPVALVVM